MKKLLVILALPLFLMSCGGDGGTASSEAGAFVSFVSLWSMYNNALNTNVADATQVLPCDGGGNIELSESNSEVTAAFVNCKGDDEVCKSSEKITTNGTINYSVNATTYDVTIEGTLVLTGAITENCGIDLVISSGADVENPDDIEEYIEGTVCGYTVAEVADVTNAQITAYCDAQQE